MMLICSWDRMVLHIGIVHACDVWFGQYLLCLIKVRSRSPYVFLRICAALCSCCGCFVPLTVDFFAAFVCLTLLCWMRFD